MRLDVRQFPTDISACAHCAEPAELGALTPTADRGRVCEHCLTRDDCALCGNVEKIVTMTPVPGLGRVCSPCIRNEVTRVAGGQATR